MAKKKDEITISPDEINPVDFFNEEFPHYVFDLLSKQKNWKVTGHNSLTYIVNSSDANKQMIVLDKETKRFEAKIPNGLKMPVGKQFTSFMMLQKFVFKDNFNTALGHVVIECMNNRSDYIRVGTKYLKKIYKTDRYGVRRTKMSVWDKMTIVDDHGKDALNSVAKFGDFTMIPDNKHFESQVEGNYNLYAPFEHVAIGKSKYKADGFQWIEKLLRHVFGNEDVDYEKGIRYMKVLYDHPKQALPILVLTSEERQTGKSTMVDFLNILFGANTVVINPADISNSFNEVYATKNVILIEESRFDSVQATEKLKNLATQKKISVNAKFIQQYDLPFFGKLIITSNDEQKFSKVDDKEIRYWVRKIPSLVGIANHNILEDMTKEIPYFLEYLNMQEKVDLTKSRMVFTEEEIRTDALDVVKRESRPELQKEIEIHLDNHSMQNLTIEKFYFTSSDIRERFFDRNNNISMSYINKILKSFMSLDKIEKTTRYIPIENSLTLQQDKKVGKPYVYINKFFGESIIGDDAEPNIPF